jgi:hypothetical protein
MAFAGLDDGVVVADPDPEGIFGCGRAGLRQPRRDRVQEAIDNDDPCHLCQIPMGSCSRDDVSDQLGITQLCHRACGNGARAAGRIAKKLCENSPELAVAIQDMKRKDPEKWKACCLVLRTDGSRTNQMRDQVKQLIEEIVRETKVSRKQRLLLMKKRQFCAWCKLNEDMTPEEAEQRWLADSVNPDIYSETAGGELHVSVSMPIMLTKEESLSRKRSLQKVTVMHGDEDTGLALDGLRKRDGRLGPTFDNFGGRAFATGASSASSLDPSIVSPNCKRARPGSDIFEDAGSPGAAASAGVAGVLHRQQLQLQQLQQLLRQQEQQQQPQQPQQLEPQQPQQPPQQQEPDEEACVTEEEAADPSLTPAAELRRFSLPQFLAFKKALKEEVAKAVARHNSPVRGKTFTQLLEHYFVEDARLKHDPDVANFEPDTLLETSRRLLKGVKEYLDKSIGAVKYKDATEGTLVTFLGELRDKKEEWFTMVDQIKQVCELVKDLQLGLKRAARKDKRQEGYQSTKYQKAFVAAGVPSEIARNMAKWAMIAVTKEDKEFELEHVTVLKADDNTDVFGKYLRSIMTTHAETINAQALNLVPQMKSSVIMKLLTIENLTMQLDDGTKVFKDELSAVHRPWLCMANAFASSWGEFRWPCRGLPCILMAMCNFVVVATVPIKTLLDKGRSLDSMDAWFGDDSELSEKDFCFFYLSQGEGVAMPLGCACLWSYVPLQGQTEKPEKATKGKVLVQWTLGEDPASAKAIPDDKVSAVEISHRFARLVAQHGSAKPWADLKDDLGEWFKAVLPQP